MNLNDPAEITDQYFLTLFLLYAATMQPFTEAIRENGATLDR